MLLRLSHLLVQLCRRTSESIGGSVVDIEDPPTTAAKVTTFGPSALAVSHRGSGTVYRNKDVKNKPMSDDAIKKVCPVVVARLI